MSLFRCRTRWQVSASSGTEDDQCGSGCLLVTSAFSSDDQEVILLGSFTGELRVFQPHGPREDDGDTSALPSDLMLEYQLGQPALQLAAGPFVSGSSTHQLAVLAPRSVAVHTLQVALGESELAHACSLQTVFERNLPENLGCAWQLIVGRFGAGSDAAASTMSIGVVTASGALAVYEREARQPLLLQLFSPEDLPLPGPVAYCTVKDAFLVVTPSWQLHSHKYTALAQAGREGRAPDWNVSLGDAALELEAVATSSASGGREPSLAGPELLVLGQRSLTCWQWAGTLRFARRLPAPARCMSHHLAEGSLMVLVASETLLLYRDGQLCWSSQPPFPPIIVSSITLEGVAGHLVLVSDNMEIQCCVLGTEPTLFRAPPASSVLPESAGNMRQELTRISAGIKSLTTTATVPQPELTAQMILKVSGNVTRGLLRLGVVAPLSLVSVAITTSAPVSAAPETISISSLCNSVEIPITFVVDSGPAPPNLDVHVTVSFAQADGSPHVTQAEVVTLPLALVLNPTTSQLNPQMPKISFGFNGDAAKIIKSILPGMRSQAGPLTLQDGAGQLVSLTLTSTCTVSSSSPALAALVASSVLTCPLLQPAISVVPEAVTWLSRAADQHYTACRSLTEVEESVESASVWLRQVQLRLLARYKDRSARTLNNLDVLLYEALNDVNTAANRLIEAEKVVTQSSRELSSILQLCCHLLAAAARDTERLAELRASLAIDNVHKHWVEGVTAALEKGSPGSSSSLNDAQPARVKSLLARTFARLVQAPSTS